jgi:hypothetical protein
MASSLGKMPTTSARCLISRFTRSRGLVEADLWPVLSREVHVGERVLARGVHQGSELRLLLAERVGDDVPLVDGIDGGLLGEDRPEHRGAGRALLRRGVDERISHPVNAAALVSGVEGPPGGGAQSLVVVGDHQLHPAQSTIGKAAEEVRLEGFGLEEAGGDAENLAPAILVDRDGHYHRPADDPAAIADLQVGRVQPEVGPGALQRPREEGTHPHVDLGAEPADLALRHAARAHGLDEIVDRPCRDAMDVSLLDDGDERLLGRPSRLQEAREVAPLAQLRDRQVDPAGPRVPVPLAIAIALVLPERCPHALRGACQQFHLGIHDALGREGQHLAHQIRVCALLHQLSCAILSSVIVVSGQGSRSRNPNLY